MKTSFHVEGNDVYYTETNLFVGSLNESGEFISAPGLEVVPKAVYDSLKMMQYRSIKLEGAALLAAKRSDFCLPESQLD